MKGSISFLMLGITGLFSVMAGMMGGFLNSNHSASATPSNYYGMMNGVLNSSGGQGFAAQCAGMMSAYGVNLNQTQINAMSSMMQNGGMNRMMG
jgi:uncharacterized protein YneF (UPF0154 family)